MIRKKWTKHIKNHHYPFKFWNNYDAKKSREHIQKLLDEKQTEDDENVNSDIYIDIDVNEKIEEESCCN